MCHDVGPTQPLLASPTLLQLLGSAGFTGSSVSGPSLAVGSTPYIAFDVSHAAMLRCTCTRAMGPLNACRPLAPQLSRSTARGQHPGRGCELCLLMCGHAYCRVCFHSSEKLQPLSQPLQDAKLTRRGRVMRYAAVSKKWQNFGPSFSARAVSRGCGHVGARPGPLSQPLTRHGAALASRVLYFKAGCA